MRRLLMASGLAVLGAVASAHPSHAAPDYKRICANVLRSFPTPAPLVVVVGKTEMVTCQPEAAAHYHKIVLPFDRMSDMLWWQEHSEVRVVIPGEGEDD